MSAEFQWLTPEADDRHREQSAAEPDIAAHTVNAKRAVTVYYSNDRINWSTGSATTQRSFMDSRELILR